MPTAISTDCRARDCASSRSTGRGAGRTWRCTCLPMRSRTDRPIKIFNNGEMRRDFTYVDDVSEAVVRLMDHVPQPGGTAGNPGTSAAPWRVYNIGNNRPEELMKVVALFEQELGRTAQKEFLPMQPGDVLETYADIKRPRARDRLSAENLDRGGDSPLRRLVPRLSQDLTSRESCTVPADDIRRIDSGAEMSCGQRTRFRRALPSSCPATTRR